MSRSLHRPSLRLERSRLLALPLVVACVLAYGSSVLHFALVQHATCLEHGEVMHVTDAGGGAVVPVEVSFDDARVSTAGTATESHSAEAHCVHAFNRREAPPPAQGATLVSVVPARSAPAMTVFRFQAEPVARLHLAPKSSPPRA